MISPAPILLAFLAGVLVHAVATPAPDPGAAVERRAATHAALGTRVAEAGTTTRWVLE